MDNSLSLALQISQLQEKAAQSGEHGNTRARNVAQRLMGVSCPYLEGMEEPVVQGVVLTPGDARIRVIQWLVGRFHPRLHDVLFDSDVSVSTIPRLTTLLADMGMCRRDDYEVVRGTTTLRRQVQFLETLLDLVEVAGWDTLNHSLTNTPDRVAAKAEQCCFFTDALCRREDLSTVFPTFVSLLPPDLAWPSEGGKADKKAKDKRVAVPPLPELKKQKEEARAQLEERRTELDEATQSHTYTELIPSSLESSLKALSVSLTTLNQLLDNFTHCYEAEMQPWTARQPPLLTTLGPTCRQTHTHLQHVNKLLQCLGQLETTLTNLEQLRHFSSTHNALFGDVCPNVQELFKECADVINECLVNQ